MNQYYPIISISGLNPHAKMAQSQAEPEYSPFSDCQLITINFPCTLHDMAKLF